MLPGKHGMLPGKHPRNVPISPPPPCRLMSQVGKRVARQHHATGGGPRLPRRSAMLAAVCEFISLARLQIRSNQSSCCPGRIPVEPIIMLPALARRSSTSAGKPRPTQKYHLCRQASPDAEVIGARLPRTKQTLPAIMPDAARDRNRCRHRSPTQKSDVCARHSMPVDARSRMRTITRMTLRLI